MALYCVLYQSVVRQYGFYTCTYCFRNWESANSWMNNWQKCRVCNTAVIAYKQQPLNESFYSDDFIMLHPNELCEKCINLGISCTQYKL